MNKNKIFLFLFSLITLTACSSIDSYIPSFLTEGSTPAAIQEAVASRVNPDKELYSVASSQLSKSGSTLAQSRANNSASESLRRKVKSEVEAQLRGYLEDMDAFSKSIVNPAFSDLANYSTDLSMKKSSQKGAWEDSEKVYSLITVDRSEVMKITDTVFKDFIKAASKNLENIK